MSARQREEVPNVYLAELIRDAGIKAAPETIQEGGKHRPDVLILFRGMRIVIEGKYEDVQGAEKAVLNDAQKRIDLGVAHISLAVIYPSEIRTTESKLLKRTLKKTNFRFCVLSEVVGQSQWHDGGIDDILGEIRRAQENMSKQDVVQQAAEELSRYLDGVGRFFQDDSKVCDDLSSALGVGKPSSEKRSEKVKRQQTVSKVAALTLANAYIFQEQLAGSGVKGVESLHETLRHPDLVQRSIKNWDWICKKINYVPIFKIASDILGKIPAGTNADVAVKHLAQQSLKVCANKAALRHDLMGRIYHYLLHEAKYLGTYYTSVPAATLLLKLALDPERWPDKDFGKADTLKDFRVVDLTCGTGTLLMATCQAMTDNFVLSLVKSGRKIDEKRLGELHKALMHDIIHGYDVLTSAIHLTASTLALLSPQVVFNNLHLYKIPLTMRGKTALLGSLEFIGKSDTASQFSFFGTETYETDTHAVTGKGLKPADAHLPLTDLFAMNPPFTRSVNSNLLFGSLPDKHRENMQAELKRRVAAGKFLANITAGLGSVFVAVADRHIKPGGRLAFVLPAALTTGIAWKETRRLIQQNYHLEYVIVSHDPKRWSFSENTNLSELLFIARRLENGERNDEFPTVFVNLWRNPDNISDALAVARLIQKTKPVEITKIEINAVANLNEYGRKYGEALKGPMKRFTDNWWCSSFAQTELIKTGYLINQGILYLPARNPLQFKVKKLRELAELGPDTRDIHDGFDVVEYATNYAALWNHESDKIVSMGLKHSRWLSPRSVAAPGREKIHNIASLWNKASRFVIVERLRLNTHRVISGIVDKPVLGNTWWEITLKQDGIDRAKALSLFFNSSLGVVLLLFNRVPAEGAWINFKKPGMLNLSVLDIDLLSSKQLNQLALSYDVLAVKVLLPLSQMAEDPVRAEIDNAISAALGLPDLTPLRVMIGREPIVTNRSMFIEEPTAKEESPQMELIIPD